MVVRLRSRCVQSSNHDPQRSLSAEPVFFLSNVGSCSHYCRTIHYQSHLLTLILMNKLSLPLPFLTVNQSGNSMLFVPKKSQTLVPDEMVSDLDQRQCLPWFSRTRPNGVKYSSSHTTTYKI